MITNQFQNIILNLKPITRMDMMEGKSYLVAPMVMLTVGVHKGSNGALYYPEEELSKTPIVWNHKPIVVYHPDGSACKPDILTNRKIGLIMNTIFEDGKLKAEAWLDRDRVKLVDERIMNAIEKNQMMELSTGLFTDNESMEGEYKGEKYSAIAKNYRPDHLAILPDLKGACSIEDGAGFLRLNEEKKDVMINGKSFNQISDLLNTKLQDTKKGAWVNDVFGSYFIYSLDGKLYKQNYSLKNDVVKIEGLSEQVVRSIEYKTLNGKSITNSLRKEKNMGIKQFVDKLIANESTKLGEEDRDWLMSLKEEQLAKLEPVVPVVNQEEEVEEEEEEEVDNKCNGNKKKVGEEEEEEDKKPKENQTVDEFISSAPVEMQSVLRSGLSAHRANKARLIKAITANKKCKFSNKQLEDKPLEELELIASLAVEKAPALNYEGQGDEADEGQQVEQPLELPVMNFTPGGK